MPTRLHPYLSFDGNCAEAFHFYNKCIASDQGELAMRTHASAPPGPKPVDAAWGEKILHAQLIFGDLVLFGSAIPPAHRVSPNPMVNLSLHFDTMEQTEQAFQGLSEGGTVFMPLQQTFWAERFGMLRDRYGFSWMVSFSHAQ